MDSPEGYTGSGAVDQGRGLTTAKYDSRIDQHASGFLVMGYPAGPQV